MPRSSMLEITEDQKPSKKVTANLLPCRVHHNGPVDPVTAYWTPEPVQDETTTAYFRGRKLKGRAVALPEQYRGVVLKQDKESLMDDQEEDGDEEAAPKVEAMELVAEFNEMVVWSHEGAPDAAADPYLRGIEEWLQMASKTHSYEMPEATK